MWELNPPDGKDLLHAMTRLAKLLHIAFISVSALDVYLCRWLTVCVTGGADNARRNLPRDYHQ